MQRIEIPFSQFSSMVRRVARVVSKDESRAILTGVLDHAWRTAALKMVATDSYRLAITEADLPDASAPTSFRRSFRGIVPFRRYASLSRSEDDSALSLALAENQIVVTCGDTVFINRRIEGNFPNYKPASSRRLRHAGEASTSTVWFLPSSARRF